MVRYLSLFILISSLGLSFEGLYEVRLNCEDRDNPNCIELNRTANLAIIKTPKLVAVSIGYPEQSLTRYAFVSEETQLSDGRYVGVQPLSSDSIGKFSQIQIDFSDQGESPLAIQGFIRDARFVKDILISGTQILPVKALSRDDLSEENFALPNLGEGRFIARGKNRNWLLTIRKAIAGSESGDLLAEVTDLGNPSAAELASGERIYLKSMRNENKQFEFFTPLSQNGAYLKWVILADLESIFRVTKLTGFFYSSNGVYSPLTIERL